MYLSDISYPCIWISWLCVLLFNIMFLYPGTPIGDVQLYLQALVTLWPGLLVYTLDRFRTYIGYLFGLLVKIVQIVTPSHGTV